MITFRAPGQPEGTTILHGRELDKLQYHMNRLARIATGLRYERLLLPPHNENGRIRDSYMEFVVDALDAANERLENVWWIQPTSTTWVFGLLRRGRYTEHEQHKAWINGTIQLLIGTNDDAERRDVVCPDGKPDILLRVQESQMAAERYVPVGTYLNERIHGSNWAMLELNLDTLRQYRTEVFKQDEMNTQALNVPKQGPQVVIPPVVGDVFVASMQEAMSAATDLPEDKIREDMIHDTGRGSLINQEGFVAHTGIGSVPWSVPRKDDPNNSRPSDPSNEDHSSGTAALGSMH